MMDNLFKKLFSFVEFPILINSFNRPTYLQFLVEQFNRLGIKPIIIDNNSSNNDFIKFYENYVDKKFFLIKLNQNFGHNVIFLDEIYNNLPNYFAYTDCDLKLNENLPKNFINILCSLTDEFGCFKAGFALDINKLNLKNQKNKFGDTILDWEKQFWLKKVIHPTYEIYSSVIDTTFAVYNKNNDRNCGKKTKFNAIRVANEFTAIHYPWVIDDPMPEDELKEYLLHDKKKLVPGGTALK